MKAVILKAPYVCEVEERPMPECMADDSVVIRVKYVGICGSDTHMYRENIAGYPRVPGHEVVGTVVAIGDRVTRVAVGDRVVFEQMVSCGKCYACRKGYPNVCVDVKCVGVHADGGMQAYFHARERYWHKLPDALSWEAAVLIEPYTVAVEGVARANIQPGETVLVEGAGSIGLAAIDIIKHIPHTQCVVSEIVDGRLARARMLGADQTINTRKSMLYDTVMEYTHGRGVNALIDAAGIPWNLPEVIRVMARNGRIACVGNSRATVDFDAGLFCNKELEMRGSRMQQNRFGRITQDFMTYASSADVIVTNIFPCEQAREAFALAAQAGSDTAKVVVAF